MQQSSWPDIGRILQFDNGAVIASIVLVLVVFAARIILIRFIVGKEASLSDTRRRWISIVQNTSIILGLLGLIFIWSPQLSTFALSLTAFAVATVIATKEYLLCVVGALYRATSNPFTVGDWVEIQGMRGEVIVEGILTTKLQELGTSSSRFEFTGRVLTIPNSVLLTQTVFNESYRKGYLHHSFTVTVEGGVDPNEIVSVVKPILLASSEADQQIADKYKAMVKRVSRTDLPSLEPKISVSTTTLGKMAFTSTLFCAASNASDIEEKATMALLKKVASILKAKAKSAS